VQSLQAYTLRCVWIGLICCFHASFAAEANGHPKIALVNPLGDRSFPYLLTVVGEIRFFKA
jgi:hypothetical protein